MNSEENKADVQTLPEDECGLAIGRAVHAMEEMLSGMRTRREEIISEVSILDDTIASTQRDLETAKTFRERSSFGDKAAGQ